jgi:hypothetical protein
MHTFPAFCGNRLAGNPGLNPHFKRLSSLREHPAVSCVRMTYETQIDK